MHAACAGKRTKRLQLLLGAPLDPASLRPRESFLSGGLSRGHVDVHKYGHDGDDRQWTTFLLYLPQSHDDES